MKNCTTLYNSTFVQDQLQKKFKIYANKLIKEEGGLPEFCWRDFKKGYKKGFMETCKMRKKKMTLNKKRYNKTKKR
jgi:hypothetical protein